MSAPRKRRSSGADCPEEPREDLTTRATRDSLRAPARKTRLPPLPQSAAVTGVPTATLPQARMDSAGSGNVTCQRTLHAGGKQGGKENEQREEDFLRRARRKACDWLRADVGKDCAVRFTGSPAPPRSTAQSLLAPPALLLRA